MIGLVGALCLALVIAGQCAVAAERPAEWVQPVVVAGVRIPIDTWDIRNADVDRLRRQVDA